jgi:hypothetical protein
MSVKPETRFSNSIRKLVSVYSMKNSNPFVGGIPDLWFSGNRGDLWIEMKYLPKLPLRADVDVPKKLLSPLQVEWLNRRYGEGRTVAVVVGCPEGGIIMRDQEWMWTYTPQMFRDRLVPRTAIAQWITQTTTR